MAKLSLTAFANTLKDKEISREMLLQTFIEWGFVEDIRRITEKGLEKGCSYCHSEDGNSSWPVYDENVQKLVLERIDAIKEHFSDPVAKAQLDKLKPKKKSANTTTGSNTVEIPTSDKKYRYLDLNDFVIIDTETTGLEEDDEIVELSVVDMSGNELYHSYYMPTKDINPNAARVNHLSKRVLEKKGAVKFDTVEWEKIKKCCNGLPIMGHNIPFDQRLVRQTALKNNVCDIKEVDDVFATLYDTKVIAKKWIDSKSYSLNNLTTLVGITREEQHDSTDDCRMTLEFVNRLEDIITIRNEYNFLKF